MCDDKPVYWNHRSEDDRVAFMRLLRPLVAASKAKDFDDEADAKTVLTLWMVAFSDVPRDVVAEACERLFMRGVTFMPRHGEVKAMCADIIEARRAAMTARVEAMKTACGRRVDGACVNGFLEEDVDGVRRARRCDCTLRGIEMLKQVAAPIARPLLADATEAV